MNAKWILTMVLVIAMIGTVSALEETPNLVLSPAKGMPGDTVTIPITLNNADDITSMDFKFVSWSSSCDHLYKIVTIEKGSLTQNSLFDWKQEYDDKARISFASSQPITGTGTVAIVMVKVKPTPQDKFCYMRVEGIASYDKYSEARMVLGQATFTIAPASKGDGDGDGQVTTKDVLAALQMAVGKAPPNMVYDMNGDQKVDSNDVRDILKLSVTPATFMDLGMHKAETPAQINDSPKSGSMQKWKP